MTEEDFRRYLDEMLGRHAEVTQQMINAIQAMSVSIQAGFSELQAEIADQREDIRASTEATWRMLDRFGEGPSPAQG